jgi:hypothetical protein
MTLIQKCTSGPKNVCMGPYSKSPSTLAYTYISGKPCPCHVLIRYRQVLRHATMQDLQRDAVCTPSWVLPGPPRSRYVHNKYSIFKFLQLNNSMCMCVTVDIFAPDDKVRKLWALPEDFHVPIGKFHGLCTDSCTDSIKPSLQFLCYFVLINASEGSLRFQNFV